MFKIYTRRIKKKLAPYALALAGWLPPPSAPQRPAAARLPVHLPRPRVCPRPPAAIPVEGGVCVCLD